MGGKESQPAISQKGGCARGHGVEDAFEHAATDSAHLGSCREKFSVDELVVSDAGVLKLGLRSRELQPPPHCSPIRRVWLLPAFLGHTAQPPIGTIRLFQRHHAFRSNGVYSADSGRLPQGACSSNFFNSQRG